MSTILAGILHGLDNDLPLQEEVEGNGLEQEGLPFPIRQSDALWEFMQNDSLRELLVSVLATCITPVKTMN
jgi:gamma-glutamylputrescine synthase